MSIRAFNVSQQLRLVRQAMGNSRLQSDRLFFNRFVKRRFDSALFSGNAVDCHYRIFGRFYDVFHLRFGYNCFDGTDAIRSRIYEFTASQRFGNSDGFWRFGVGTVCYQRLINERLYEN